MHGSDPIGHLPVTGDTPDESDRPAPHRISGPVVLGALIIVAIGIVALATAPGSSRHPDGSGPLASRDGPGSETMAVDPTPIAAWTFGLRLCVAETGASIVLRSVGPTTAVGSGFRFLGAGVREFQPTRDHTGIIAVDGYPPPSTFVPDPVAGVAGFRVRTPCANDPSAPYTELLVGLGRVSHDGGGWKGIDVVYESAGRRRVLAIDHNLLICGAAVASFCVIPGSSNGGALATQ